MQSYLISGDKKKKLHFVKIEFIFFHHKNNFL